MPAGRSAGEADQRSLGLAELGTDRRELRLEGSLAPPALTEGLAKAPNRIDGVPVAGRLSDGNPALGTVSLHSGMECGAEDKAAKLDAVVDIVCARHEGLQGSSIPL